MATITDFLNHMNDIGVFSYVLPFLLIFAVVFALIEKTGILSKKGSNDKVQSNRGVSAIVAAAIGLLALQFDHVPIFFAKIFPNLGIGISILLVILILAGFTGVDLGGDGMKRIGWIVAILAVLYALFNWNNIFGTGGIGINLQGLLYGQQLWSIIWIIIIIAVIYLIVRKPKEDG